jgi:putative cardiolipin synthase
MRSARFPFRWLGPILGMLLLASCATLKQDAPRGTPSHALAPDPTAPLGVLSAQHLQATGSASAFRLIDSGQAALAARMALIEQARHSLDIQYYIFRADTSGKLMMDALIRAAERGVRVRLLLDDMYSPDNEPTLIGLDAQPRIQVRLYNPFNVRGNSPLGRFMEFVSGDGRVNRRMHNKLFLADNHFGITGGRNIGDEYFQADASIAFRDLDVLATGPVVRELSEAFDRYWNADRVVTTRALPDTASPRKQLRDALAQDVAALRESQSDSLNVFRRIDALGPAEGPGWGRWTAGRAEVLIDAPGKTDKAVKRADLPINLLLRQGMETHRELLIASPYFVPGEEGVEWLRQIASRPGVSVSVLTNSLATTDVAVVHAGYSGYRRPLLEAGVKLYELKPRKERRAWGPHLLRGSSRASLHGKAVVFDRESAYVGSMNLDPRSVVLNTESGLILYGAAIAGQVADFIEQAMHPERSYRLTLDRANEASAPELVWHDQQPGGEVLHHREPRTGAGLRTYIKALSLLPIEADL